MLSRFFALVALLCMMFVPANGAATTPSGSAMRTIMNFDNGPDEPRWIAVNDGVMGGRSSGQPKIESGELTFSGELSLANNGGFASARSVGVNFDLSDAATVVLRVRGDGRRYQLRLATDADYRGVSISYGTEFETVADEWIEARLLLASLTPTVRGSPLGGPPLDASQVREIGLLIADKHEGAFALSVDWIAVE